MSVNPLTDPQGAAEAAAERAKARQSRRAFAVEDSAFVRAMKAVTVDYLAARAAGVSREDAVKGIEAVLRDVWPVRKLSKFQPACAQCDDTGYVERTCSRDLRCGRERCHKQHPAWEHAYVEPCGCPAGDKKRTRQRSTEDALAAVGKTQKKRGSWPRVGGRTRWGGGRSTSPAERSRDRERMATD